MVAFFLVFFARVLGHWWNVFDPFGFRVRL